MFLLLLVATILMLFVSYLSFRKRKIEVAAYNALVMLSASFYSFGYAFEVMSTDPGRVRLWLGIQYIGIPFISTFWLLLVIFYTGHRALLKRWVILLLFTIPALTLVLHYTNDLHHFYYKDIQYDFNTSHLSPVLLLKGPWYWVQVSYNYVLASAGMFLFTVMYLKAVPLVRKQVVLMMLGGAAPWLSNLMYLGFQGIHLDWTPFGFTLSGLIYIWGIYRFNLLRLGPLALQTVFETMQDGVIIVDYDNNITHSNEAAKGIFGELPALPDRLKSIYDVLSAHPDLLSKLKEPMNSENQISIRQDEKMRYYHVKISVIRDRDRHILGKMLILSDITQITEYQDTLLSNAEQLAELNAFKDKLFTVVTHDIRDPLALLVNLTEIIEEDFVDAGSEEFNVFHEVSSQVRDTYMLVENLLDWFRSQKGKASFSPLVWDLALIVQKSVATMEARSELKHIHLISSVHEGILVFADKEMMDLVLRNLLSNAIKFTEIGGHIHIEARQEEGKVTVLVRDSGVGVDPKVGGSLFHDVQQGSKAGTDGEKGSGLGLYLCAKFVHLNGGNIWFESNTDHGSTFLFTLPAKDTVRAQLRIEKELAL
ncbi:ATP-binding protein [Paenibacillus mendelii]|nr:ATP-binding protein [Paenibacillus mendelii]